MRNPFTPTFGIVPAHLAGRQSLLTQMRRSFENGVGDPNLSSIIVGPRGSGKTALLSCIGDEAMQAGWIVTNTTASAGMLDDILERTLTLSADIIKPKSGKKITGMTIGQLIGVEWTEDKANEPGWRTRMTLLLDELKERGTGLLITVDEVRADIDEMIYLASTYQLLLREGAKIALVMAGLSGHVNGLMHDESVSFLRRSRQHILERISDTEVERAFRKTVEEAGKDISADALNHAVAASEGYAYMVQLVGYSIWEESGSEELIDVSSAQKGIIAAKNEFKNGVLNSTYRELSVGDRNFLFAMLEDEGSSRITDIALRMNKTTGYVSTYKSRLLMSGVIDELPDRTLRFALPSFREYLKEMA